MLKTKILLGLLFILFGHCMHAQHQPCGYDLAVDQMEKKYPGYRQLVQQTMKKAKQDGAANRNSNMVYKVPVVIHIVWKNEEENLSEELIDSQMEVLNEDYRRLNPNANEVRPIFDDVVGDPMIEFELVEIIRTQTGNEFSLDLFTGALPDNVKSSASGGSDGRDPDKFLNIWICKIQPITIGTLSVGQLLGYAYPPVGLEHWPAGVNAPSPSVEGVVLDYRTIGRNSPFTIDPGLGQEIQMHGRAATHEVGHYLGLMHIWGINDDPFGIQDSCNSDDGMDDTPNAGSQSTFDCDHTKNSCIIGMNDQLDMVENYMDYSNEACQNSFTMDQIAMMRGVLEGPRCGLVGLCDPTSSNNLLSRNVEIFPNPSNSHINIIGLNEAGRNFQYIIYNNIGQELISGKGSQNAIEINQLKEGIYYLKLISDDEELNLPFIKN